MLLPTDKKALKKLVFFVLCVSYFQTAVFAQTQLALDKATLNNNTSSIQLKPSSALPANKVLKEKKIAESTTLDVEKIILVNKTAPLDVDIYTLPLYGEFEKSAAQKAMDELFIKECQKEFKTTQEAAQFFVKMAWQYLEEGDKNTALVRFNYAWLLDKDQTDAYWGLGVLEYQAGNFSNAVSLLNRGLALSDKNYIMMVDLATVYLKMATQNQNSLFEINEAKLNILKAIEIQPSYTNAYMQLATLNLIDNQIDKAWESFHKGYKLNPNEINQELLSELLSKQADPKGVFKKD